MNIRELARKLLVEIDDLTELLYQSKEKEGYVILEQVVMDLQNLITGIVSYQQENNLKIVDENQLLESVGQAFQAMQEKDHVLLADIFSYDIKEQLEQLA